MPDRDKVIKGLECCTRHEIGKQLNNCLDCPYVEQIGFNQFRCKSQEMKEDALALLKEQDELLRKKQKDVDRLCNEISEWKHKFHDKSLKEQEALAVREDKVNKCVCGNEINRYWHPEYCGFCGKKLVWY